VDTFIQTAMQSLGTDERSTRSATGGILNLMKKHADGAEFQKLLGALPGAEALMKQGPAPGIAEGLGGFVGDIVGELSGKVREGEAIGGLAFLTRSGLDIGKITQLVGLFLKFAKTKAGADLVDRIANAVPELHQLRA